MPKPALTKNAFIELLAGAFLSKHPAWGRIYQDKRSYLLALGREVRDDCLVFVDFSCRPDRYWFGHGVGWCPSKEYFLEWQARRVNPPHYPRDGSLRRLLRLESPRDFQTHEMRISTGSLVKPFAEYNLEERSPEELLGEIQAEIDDYALPYLCMMLKARHGLQVQTEELAASPF